MLNLEYKKGDIFANLNKDAIHLHACNGQGKWGPVIAALFKQRFPKSFQVYASKPNNSGDGYIIDADDFKVGCLITSKYYGSRKDPPKTILINTYLALKQLLNSHESNSIIIQSPKINSGQFNVPWDLTERVIKRACEEYDKEVTWIVWDKA